MFATRVLVAASHISVFIDKYVSHAQIPAAQVRKHVSQALKYFSERTCVAKCLLVYTSLVNTRVYTCTKGSIFTLGAQGISPRNVSPPKNYQK